MTTAAPDTRALRPPALPVRTGPPTRTAAVGTAVLAVLVSDLALAAVVPAPADYLWLFAAKNAAVVAGAALWAYTVAARAERPATTAGADLLRAVAEGTTDAVFVKDAAGRYEYFNAAAAAFVGRPVEDVLGRDDTALFDPESARKVLARDRAVMRGGAAETQEEVLSVHGVTRTYLSTKAPYRNARGEIVGVIGISRDITDRKRAEFELRATEVRLRALADAIPQIVWAARPDGSITHLNAKAAEYAGDAAASLTGWAWDRIVHPDDLPAALERWAATRDDGRPRDIAFRLRRADGAYRWHIGRQVPARDANGTVTGWYGTCTDVDDLKRAEAALGGDRALLRTVVDSIPDLIFVKDAAGRFTLCNRALVEFAGAAVEADLLGKSVHDFFPADHARQYDEDDTRVLRGGETILNREELARDAAGRETWRQVIKVPLRDAAGAVVGLVGVSRDIQRRKDHERDLAQSRERLALALAAANFGTWDWDLRTNDVVRSPELFAILGVAAMPPGHTAFLDAVHPEDAAAVDAAYNRAAAAGATVALEFRVVRPTGEVRWVYETGRTQADGGGPATRMTGFIQDITERKRAEQDLLHSRALLGVASRVGRTGAWWVDVPAFTVTWSDELRAILEIPPDRAPGVDEAIDFYAPEYRDRVRQFFTACVRTGTPFDAEVETFTAAGGRRFWVRIMGEAVRDAAGAVVRVQGAFQDIDDRKRGEQTLRFQHALLRCQSEASPDGILVVGPTMRVLSYNRMFHTVWRIPESLPAAGDDGAILAHARGLTADPAAFSERVAAIYAQPDLSTTEEVALADGRTLDRYSGPIRGAGGELLGRVWYFRDITERKRTEAALRDRERLLAAVTASARLGLLMIGEGYEYLFANQAYADIVGTAVPDIVGRRVPDLVPERWALARPSIDRAFAGEWDSYEFEGPARPGDSGPRLFRAVCEPRCGDAARPRVVIVVIDITDQTRAERALRVSEERYRSLVDVLPGAVFIHAGGRIVFCNPALVRLLGAAGPEDILGRGPLDFVHPDDRDLVGLRIAAMRESGRAVPPAHIRFLHRDGRPVPVYSVGTPIAGFGDSGILVALSDLTERERATALLRSVLASVADAILTIDGRGRVRSANPATERLFGFAEAELLGTAAARLLPDAFRPNGARVDDGEFAPGLSKVIGIGREYTGRRKDGSDFPLELTVTEFALNGERQFTAVVRDVSARKVLEEQLRQAQKMEAVGQLAGGVAHDFNNLLTVINGYGEIVLGGMDPADPKRAPVAAIRDAGERAARLTSQLLAFSRKAIVELKVLDLNELTAESARLLRRLIGETIVLTVLPDPRLPKIRADIGQIEQVVMNLVVNARDAMPKGGRLTVETRARTVGPDDAAAGVPPGLYAELTVSDTGHGMADDVKRRLFEPFFTTKGVGKGTGLGLAVVHGVVKQSGGAIAVESAVGLGTKFALLFPSAEPAAAGAAGPAPVAARGTETVLLVEDEDAVRTIAQISLSMQGFRVLEADSGVEALRVAAAHAQGIDLLVTDVVMPEMGGRQLVETLRAARPDLRVLYMSGYTDDAVVQHGVSEATDAFIQKPFTPLGLARKARAVLDRPG